MNQATTQTVSRFSSHGRNPAMVAYTNTKNVGLRCANPTYGAAHAWQGQIPLNPPFTKGEAKPAADSTAATIPPFEKAGLGGISTQVYQDIPGFCRSVPLAEIAEHDQLIRQKLGGLGYEF